MAAKAAAACCPNPASDPPDIGPTAGESDGDGGKDDLGSVAWPDADDEDEDEDDANVGAVRAGADMDATINGVIVSGGLGDGAEAAVLAGGVGCAGAAAYRSLASSTRLLYFTSQSSISK